MSRFYFAFLLTLIFVFTGCSKKDDAAAVKCCNDSDFRTSNPSRKLSFLLPNAITPNNDGRNDTFIVLVMDTTTRPTSQAVFASRKLRIYDPGGRLVYQNNNYLNNFNGQDGSGRELPEGTYRYELELDNNTATGNLCVIRNQRPCPCRLIDRVDPAVPNCHARPLVPVSYHV